jgi:FkbM family methyltransferase
MKNEMLTSFTHNCEDILLLRALCDIESGFYIDVGAYDPVMDSVTKVFYDRGWRGVNLEPNEMYFARLQEARPRDHNLLVGASDKAGSLDFYVVENTGLSTLDEDQARISANDVHPIRKTSIKTETLAVLWERYIPQGQPVHFLKIDVEGAEEKVIAGANWERHRPWILVIEATVPNSAVISSASWEPMVLAADYLLAYFDGVNRYYVAKEKSELLSAFDRPANPMIDNFKPFLAELIERNKQETIDALQQEVVGLRERVDTAERDRELMRVPNAALERQQEEIRGQINELQSIKEHLWRVVEEFSNVQVLVNLLRQQAESLEALRAPANRRRIWEKIVFRSNGRPKKIFLRALFHKSGKPRGIFRDLVLKHDNTPHSPFRRWMTSPEYQQLRSAIKFGVLTEVPAVTKLHPVLDELSPRAVELLMKLEERASQRGN